MGLSKRQLEIRRGGIGASEIAVLAGLSRYSAPINIYLSKIGQALPLDSYAADLGVVMEQPLAQVYAKRFKRAIAMVDTLVHPTRPYALATPDRAVYLTKEARGPARARKTDVRDAERLLQIKSTNWRLRRMWGDDGTDRVPDEYLCQVQWEMGVAGVSSCDIFVDFDKTAGHVYPIRFRPGIFEHLYEVAERFMVDHVAARVPPDPDASEAYHEYLEAAFPREKGKRDDLRPVSEAHEPKLWEALHTFAKCTAADKRLELAARKARNIIEAAIGEGAGLMGPWGKVTWLTNKASVKTDWMAVARELQTTAALAVQALQPSQLRVDLGNQIKELETKHTKIVPGSRTMRKTWEGDLRFEVEVLELRLDRLQQTIEGEVTADNAAAAPTH